MAKETNIKELLDKQEKVMVRIPTDKRNPDDKYVIIKINGYRYQIERGQSVKVPQEVYNILEESGYLG